jgi:UDP-N-acetylglucosamine/UDP-N-acetylgalactosamine 4-epimerase
MMTAYDELCSQLRAQPRRWLVTGVAGFIGSHLLETLLRLGQSVTGVDNFTTGRVQNLSDVSARVGAEAAARFELIEGDIRDLPVCRSALRNVDLVLHQAAIGSVPRSVDDPLESHASNVTGFLKLLIAARDAGVERVVYASSSAIYGDDDSETKSEDRIGSPLSPYAVTKLADELYAGVFARVYGIESVGLRYFNVFGPRQDPNGPYAAVIPRWTELLLKAERCVVYGDAEKSRDFCYVDNVVQANLLTAFAPTSALKMPVMNIACGERTTLRELYSLIRTHVATHRPDVANAALEQEPPRLGDIAHSLASIERAREQLGYEPTHDVARGIGLAVAWYVEQVQRARVEPATSVTPRIAAR